jgi:hypothetical protein
VYFVINKFVAERSRIVGRHVFPPYRIDRKKGGSRRRDEKMENDVVRTRWSFYLDLYNFSRCIRGGVVKAKSELEIFNPQNDGDDRR